MVGAAAEKYATNAKEIVRRDWFKEDPILRDLLILKMANQTNYAIDPTHARRLEALWANTGRGWNEDESIGGLWAYARTYGGELSKLAGSTVADVALQVGRSVGSVYNKILNFRHIDPRDPRDGLSGLGETDRRVWASFYEDGIQQLDIERLDATYASLWGTDGEWASGHGESAPSSRPRSPTAPRARGQGYEKDPRVRRAIELRAMALAATHYQAQGFTVEDTSGANPFDLRCTRDGHEVRVEAKGTRSDGSTIEVTLGEVENARGTPWRTDLFVVSGIVLARSDGNVTAHGGTVRVVEGWRPTADELTAVRFRCTVPSASGAK